MNRRNFLQHVSIAGAVAVVGGGVWARRTYASQQLTKKLVVDTLPVLTKNAHAELQKLPVAGREEIKQWFHGKCLNVSPFVEQVCSNSYREKLNACPDEEQKHDLLLVSFCGKVVTDAEILNRVETIAQEVGQDLDRNWSNSCTDIASKWNIHIKDYAKPLDLQPFLARMDKMVREQITQAMKDAQTAGHSPALGQTCGKIGECSLLLMPVTKVKARTSFGDVEARSDNPIFAIPAFVMLALKPFFQYVMALFSNPKPDIQRAVSGRLSLLANRVGSDFENEIRGRIGNLHSWQEQTLAKAARLYANEAVGWW